MLNVDAGSAGVPIPTIVGLIKGCYLARTPALQALSSRRTMTRTIIAIVDDMFFASKIRATAEAVGVEVSFPRSKDVVLEKLRTSPPDLIVADLQNQRFDVIEFAGALKADSDLRKIPLLGFFSHVEVEVQRKATAVGFDRVIPRSLFARDLAPILKGD